jgi:hypothetical protein
MQQSPPEPFPQQPQQQPTPPQQQWNPQQPPNPYPLKPQFQQPLPQQWRRQPNYAQSQSNHLPLPPQPPSPYPQQQGQWAQQPYSPYPPQQGQWQQPITPTPQWNQQPYRQPPPQQPKKKGKLLLILGVVGVLVLCVCVGASALASQGSSLKAGTTSNSSSLSNHNPTSVTTHTAVPTTKHFNQTYAAQAGNVYDIEIISAKTSPGSGHNTPQKSGDVFLVFVIKVKNISSQEQTIRSAQIFTLVDINGQKYDEIIDTDAGATLDGTVKPGLLLQGSIAYEVPATIKSFRLEYQPDKLAPGQVIWNIRV